MDIDQENKDFEYWTPRRQELYSWFERKAPGLGELYAGALNIIYSNRIPGRTRLIAHAVREIGNRLPDIITGVIIPRFEWENKLDELSVEWRKAGLFTNVQLSNQSNEIKLYKPYIEIPYNVYQSLTSVLSEHLSRRDTRYNKAKRLFNAISSDNNGSQDELIPVIKAWCDTINWFVGKAHDWQNIDSDIEAKNFYHQFEVFENTLRTIIGAFYQTLDEIDEILEEANS